MIAGAKTGNRQHNQSTRNVAIAREISIMEKLEHPNICKLVEVFFQSDNSISRYLPLFSLPPPTCLQILSWNSLTVVICLNIYSHTVDSVSGRPFVALHYDSNIVGEVEARDITYQLCDALAVRVLLHTIVYRPQCSSSMSIRRGLLIAI